MRAKVLALMLFVIAAAAVAAQKTESPDVVLKSAINRELVDGDLQAAIRRYRDIANRFQREAPAVAARALVRMAECYEKLGDVESRKIYERILREYSDQAEAASQARARLGARDPVATSTLTTRRVLDRGRPHDRISPDGRALARVENDNLVLYEFATQRARPLTTDGGVRTEPDHEFPLASVFSRDGRYVAVQWYLEKDGRSVLRIVSTAANAGEAPRTLYDNPDVQIAPTDWSPDGRWIAGVSRRKDNTAQIVLVDAKGGSLQVLKTVDWSRVGGVRFSPDSTMLAYHRPEKEGAFERDVIVIAVDGSRESTVAKSPGDDIVLEWTPDGSRLLVASDRGGSMSVWSVPPSSTSGTSYELVKSDVGIINSLGPTRDGALFYNLLPAASLIYVAKFDTASGQLASAPTQPVHQFRGSNSAPEWSADGAYLAFGSRRDIPAPINVTRIAVPILSMASGKIERELHPQISYGGVGRWSPDGKYFIVRGADLKGRSGILKVDATTGEATLLATEETCTGIPALARDGRSFFCWATPEFQRTTQSEIVQVALSTGEVLRRYPAGGQTFGASPDGTALLYADDDERKQIVFRALTLATGQSRDIIRLATPASSIGNFRSVGWTPDGRGIVFQGKINGDEGMWLVSLDGSGPRKISLPGISGRVIDWRFNNATGQVAFTTGDASAGQLEVWKMENFLPVRKALLP